MSAAHWVNDGLLAWSSLGQARGPSLPQRASAVGRPRSIWLGCPAVDAFGYAEWFQLAAAEAW